MALGTGESMFNSKNFNVANEYELLNRKIILPLMPGISADESILNLTQIEE